MRRAIVAAVVFVLSASAALAESRWNGAGWYQIEDVEIDGWIYAGPFESEAACNATLPPDDEEGEFYCHYLAEKPAWDY
jgi:hypothetical protein